MKKKHILVSPILISLFQVGSSSPPPSFHNILYAQSQNSHTYPSKSQVAKNILHIEPEMWPASSNDEEAVSEVYYKLFFRQRQKVKAPSRKIRGPKTLILRLNMTMTIMKITEWRIHTILWYQCGGKVHNNYNSSNRWTTEWYQQFGNVVIFFGLDQDILRACQV